MLRKMLVCTVGDQRSDTASSHNNPKQGDITDISMCPAVCFCFAITTESAPRWELTSCQTGCGKRASHILQDVFVPPSKYQMPASARQQIFVLPSWLIRHHTESSYPVRQAEKPLPISEEVFVSSGMLVEAMWDGFVYVCHSVFCECKAKLE